MAECEKLAASSDIHNLRSMPASEGIRCNYNSLRRYGGMCSAVDLKTLTFVEASNGKDLRLGLRAARTIHRLFKTQMEDAKANVCDVCRVHHKGAVPRYECELCWLKVCEQCAHTDVSDHERHFHWLYFDPCRMPAGFALWSFEAMSGRQRRLSDHLPFSFAWPHHIDGEPQEYEWLCEKCRNIVEEQKSQ